MRRSAIFETSFAFVLVVVAAALMPAPVRAAGVAGNAGGAAHA